VSRRKSNPNLREDDTTGPNVPVKEPDEQTDGCVGFGRCGICDVFWARDSSVGDQARADLEELGEVLVLLRRCGQTLSGVREEMLGEDELGGDALVFSPCKPS